MQLSPRDRGAASPLVLMLLLLLLALFVFSALAGARGGLSAGGCLPTSPSERRALRAGWFSPAPPRREDVTTTCGPPGPVLRVRNLCKIAVAATGPEPDGVLETIRTGFRDLPRGLSLSAPTSSGIDLDVRDRAPDARVISAQLAPGRSTSLTISRAGADVIIRCASCDVALGEQQP